MRARNGIDYQWTALKCDKFGDDHKLELDSNTEVQVIDYDGTFYAKVQGTNCAFRRKALEQVDGFDENYRYFLDETDVSLSLANSGWLTAIVPLAEVQHGFEKSAERTRHRVPHSLKNIGMSKSHFLQKHAIDDGEASIQTLRQQQRQRLIRLMLDGYIEPAKVVDLMRTLEDGLRYNSDTTRAGKVADADEKPPVFVPFVAKKLNETTSFSAVAGTALSARKLSAKALQLANEGAVVTVFRFSYTALFHRRYFDERGFWVQTGGLFGKSERDGRVFHFQPLAKRTLREVAKLGPQRSIKSVLTIRIFRDFVSLLPKTR